MSKQLFISLFSIILSFSAFANNTADTKANSLEVGRTLPFAEVNTHGELLLDSNNKITYAPWSTKKTLGKVQVINAIAGRTSSKKMNEPLIDAIIEKNFPRDAYQTTTIINQDDAIWGTSNLVKSSAESSKKEFYWSSIVLDKEGQVAKQWRLVENSSFIVLIDKKANVLFEKDGALTPEEIKTVLALIEKNL